MSTMAELESKNRDELEAIAKECGIVGYSALKKSELVHRILQAEAEEQGNVFVTGVLEIISRAMASYGRIPSGVGQMMSTYQIPRYAVLI